jgi:hypothetical protein
MRGTPLALGSANEASFNRSGGIDLGAVGTSCGVTSIAAVN